MQDSQVMMKEGPLLFRPLAPSSVAVFVVIDVLSLTTSSSTKA
jgi:hypothetical protein